MGFWDAAKDFALAMGNPQEWERQRAQRTADTSYEAGRQQRIRRLAELERQGGVDVAAMRAFVAKMQSELDARTQQQRQQGHHVRLTPKVYAGEFDGQPAIGKFFENGNPHRLDVYHGGGTDNPLENDEHGHVIVDLRHPEVPVKWLRPGPKGYREEVV